MWSNLDRMIIETIPVDIRPPTQNVHGNFSISSFCGRTSESQKMKKFSSRILEM